MSQKTVRVIALVLAVLMAGSVLIVAFTNVFAYDEAVNAIAYEDTLVAAADGQPALETAQEIPDTGTDGPPKAPIIIGAVAVVLAVACVVIPKIAKK